MIVGKGQSLTGEVVIVGLTEADIDEMRKGLTKIKEGGERFGFSSLVVFMGLSDAHILKTLSQAATIRQDDRPQMGMG